jgi:hypothetical protein
VLSSRFRLRFGRRDPWWDLEGRSVRRDRRLRHVLEIVVLVALLVLLLIVLNPPLARTAVTVVVLG